MMRKTIVKYILGKILIVESCFMVLPLIVSFIYKESYLEKIHFIIPILLCFFVGKVLEHFGDSKARYYTKEAFLSVGLGRIFLSLFGAIPLFLEKEVYPTYIDAFFEMVSGFTTTGAGVALDVELLPHSILFWRSFSHFVGGMGVLVFTLAILPKVNKQASFLMKAEVPGPTFGKIVSKLSDSAKMLYKMYTALTVVLIIFLLFGGLNLFDSMIFAFGAAGTGGFANYNLSAGAFNSRYVEVVLTIGMLVFGVNFNLYYYALIKNVREAFDSEEFKFYIAIVVFASILVFINIYGMYKSVSYTLINSFFTVSSIITTTGYVTVDFGKRPLFSRTILIILMFIGGCAGSTAGGIKVSRVLVAVKSALNEMKKSISPKRMLLINVDKKTENEEIVNSTLNYFIVYAMLFLLFLLIISFESKDFETAFAAVATTFNNVGPGLGLFGPMENFHSMSQFGKLVLSFAMLMGRLEIFPILLLFSPKTWKSSRKNKDFEEKL